MNILESMEKINAIAKYLAVAFVILGMIPAVSAGQSGIESALSSLCVLSQTLLGLVAMVLIILAGAIYAVGQILGAETRARAAVWATAMLTGAVIGIVIYLIAPWIISLLLGAQNYDSANPCAFRIGPQ